eukprot:4893333-Amphidinium_carterae.2
MGEGRKSKERWEAQLLNVGVVPAPPRKAQPGPYAFSTVLTRPEGHRHDMLRFQASIPLAVQGKAACHRPWALRGT